MKKNNETVAVCPNCGQRIAIAQHEHTVSNATVIGKDSNLGTIVLTPEGPAPTVAPMVAAPCGLTKAQERLEALKAKGVDTSNLFALKGASGEGMVLRLENGVPQIVPDDDPIFDAIVKGGTIPERRLFRRWVLAQMFEMMTRKGWGHNRPMGFTQALHDKGYDYQWKMIIDEFIAQEKLFRHNDAENFNGRNRWFNKDVAIALAKDYIEHLRKYVERCQVKHCKRRPYKRIRGVNYFVSEIETKVFSPLLRALEAIEAAVSPRAIMLALSKFNALRLKTNIPLTGNDQCREWIDAYKGVGAYYSLQNLIRFHGCTLNGRSKARSLEFLEVLAENCKDGEGWRLLGVFKECLKENNIDIEAKMAEWRNR